MSIQGHRPVKGLCLINGVLYDQRLYEIHIVSYIWPFSSPYKNLTFDEIERANQGHWVFSGLYFIN